MAACAACEGGVKRTHLVDAATDGALLLELYSRDGIGAMISADFYEVRTQRSWDHAAWILFKGILAGPHAGNAAHLKLGFRTMPGYTGRSGQ